MADELKFYGNDPGDVGLTVVARVINQAGAQVGSDVACPEVGQPARYVGDMPAAPAGEYGIRFYSGAELVGQRELLWDGTVEVTVLTLQSALAAVSSAISSLNNITAGDLRTELSAELARIDQPISSRSSHAAGDVRAELATELGRLDVAVSSRSTLSATEVWAAASRTLTEKTGFSLTVAERDAIAVAVEQAILNEADGRQVVNAIVGAINNMNVDEVALVAAIRAELERNGGTLDLIATDTTELQANQGNWLTADVSTLSVMVPSDIRAELTTELARLDQPVSSRSAHSAADVRTELTPELDRIDSAVSSRSSHSAADVRSAMSTELARVDVPVSSRSAHSAADVLTTALADGLNVGEALTRLVRHATGQAQGIKQPDDSIVWEFYEQDGTTVAFTLTTSADGNLRT